MLDRLIAVAPMLDWTDRHYRYFIRLLSRHTLLYTEMVTTGAILRGDRQRLLAHDPTEHPLALQLGGSDPAELARCACIAADWGYDEINLNVGCPSDRVQSGRFGACLMAEPDLVAACVAAMRAATDLPVTVKTRIGIDERDSYQELADFVCRVAAGGCTVFIVHARKAWLNGLSPRENRDVPPLDYPLVHDLKRAHPTTPVVLNGGLADLDQAHANGVEHEAVLEAAPLHVGRDRRCSSQDVLESFIVTAAHSGIASASAPARTFGLSESAGATSTGGS